jgi:hypothetical protein
MCTGRRVNYGVDTGGSLADAEWKDRRRSTEHRLASAGRARRLDRTLCSYAASVSLRQPLRPPCNDSGTHVTEQISSLASHEYSTLTF